MTHVFVVDKNTFKCHLEYLFAGTGAKEKQASFLLNPQIDFNVSTERNLVGMIADISRIREGDNIIFYLQSSGGKPGAFFGVFKAKTRGFFDENNKQNYLIKELGKGLSFRIKIEPKEVYSEGITEHEYLDSLDGKNHPYELCWSLIYRKLKGNRGCTMITNYEFDDLLRKLKSKNNNKVLTGNKFTFDESSYRIENNVVSNPYAGKSNNINILPRLLFKSGKGNAFETHLQAYILQNFEKIPQLNIAQSPSTLWVGNEVSCGVGMQRIDIMTINELKNKVYIQLLELKYVQPEAYIIESQIPWYIKWVDQYIAPNYDKKEVEIKPIIVAAKYNKNTKKKKCFYEAKNTFDSSLLKGIKSTVLNSDYISFDIDTTNQSISFNVEP